MANYKNRSGSIFRDLMDAVKSPPGYEAAMANTGQYRSGAHASGSQQPAPAPPPGSTPMAQQQAVPGVRMQDLPPIPKNAKGGVNMDDEQKQADEILRRK